MKELRLTLVGEGNTDRALMAPIRWSVVDWLRRHQMDARLRIEFEPGVTHAMSVRLADVVRRYPCDVLFVHRDADREGFAAREDEIARAVKEGDIQVAVAPIVPVAMTEAWFLFDESAIRRAADNPNGHVPLDLPKLKNVERIADPKSALRVAIETASEKTGRRLRQLQPHTRVMRLAELIEDYGPARALSSFKRMETCLDLHLDRWRER